VNPTFGTQLVENGDNRTLALIEDQTAPVLYQIASVFFQNEIMVSLACGHGADVSVLSGQNQHAVIDVLRQIFRLPESAGLVSIAEHCPAPSAEPRAICMPEISTEAGEALYRYLTVRPLSQASNSSSEDSEGFHSRGDTPKLSDKRKHNGDGRQDDHTDLSRHEDTAVAPSDPPAADPKSGENAWNLVQPILLSIPSVFVPISTPLQVRDAAQQTVKLSTFSSLVGDAVGPVCPSTCESQGTMSGGIIQASSTVHHEAHEAMQVSPLTASVEPDQLHGQSSELAVAAWNAAAAVMLPGWKPAPDADVPPTPPTDLFTTPSTRRSTTSQSAKKVRTPAGMDGATQQEPQRPQKASKLWDTSHFSVGMPVAARSPVGEAGCTYTGQVVASREVLDPDSTVAQLHLVRWEVSPSKAAELQLPCALTAEQLSSASALALALDGWTVDHPAIGTLVADVFQERHDSCEIEPGRYVNAEGQVTQIVLNSEMVLYVGKVMRYLPPSAELSGKERGGGKAQQDQLYHVLWADGDQEDFNETELQRGRERYDMFVCGK
jgi:hypothetical protein